ncbi:hypothetical protein KKA09_01575 [Patescibacteria group bacterium]|nr:hypothetical protein [Patescibacteria group bacterium]
MKKILSLVLIANLIACSVFLVFEPELASAVEDTVIVTQAVSAEISISSPADVTMSSAIPGVTGNLGSPRTGSATWTVITNNDTGFNMTIKSTSTPSMILDGTYNFSDYSPATTTAPDYTWSSPAASVAEFGYTVEPATVADTATFFKDNGTACNIGTANAANSCWQNASTTDVQIINRTTNTAAGGEAEVVKFQTESNAKYLQEGNYTATIIATALMN